MSHVIFDCPGYQIIGQPSRDFQPGDEIAVPYETRSHGTLYSFFTLGNLESFYAKNDEETRRAGMARAAANGHPTHWANQRGTVISDPPQPKKVTAGFKIGDTLRFAGKRFTITRTNNGNIGLVEILPCTDPVWDVDVKLFVSVQVQAPTAAIARERAELFLEHTAPSQQEAIGYSEEAGFAVRCNSGFAVDGTSDVALADEVAEDA